MIPPFDERGLLSQGIFEAKWEEIHHHLGFSERRERLLDGLYQGLLALKQAGCQRAYIDGSFVSIKAAPGDFDVCWESNGVDPDLLDPVLLTFSNQQAQKQKYSGEFFPAYTTASLNPRLNYLEFFQLDKHTKEPKGIIALDLRRLL